VGGIGGVPVENSRSDILVVEPAQDGQGQRLTDGVNRRPIGTPDRHPKGDPLVLHFERLALAPSELVGVAETGRARVGV
jgi:hypothetical protein